METKIAGASENENGIIPSGAIALAPVASAERIAALDVVRGFALIGIFCMNVEFFNRSLAELGLGMPPGLTGINWLASYFVAYFIAGKFWTIFSLLFGMGFAVMLTRAEANGRGFILPYLRRIAALAVMGMLHHILIWPGDILFSYAIGAAGLLVLLFGRWQWILLGLLALLGLGFLPDFKIAMQLAGSLAFVSVVAIFVRNERVYTIAKLRLPLFSSIYAVLGILLGVVAIVSWFIPQMKDGRIPLSIASPVTILVAFLAAKYHKPAQARTWRAGVSIYVFAFSMMTIFGVVEYFRPAPAPAAVVAAAPATSTSTAAAPVVSSTAEATKAGKQVSAKKIEKTDAEKTAEQQAERAKRIKEKKEKIQTDIKVLTQGSYTQAVENRAKDFVDHVPRDFGFATIVIAMFLIGVWFVRSGVMMHVSTHVALFRKLALFGIPLGVGMGLLGSAISTHHILGQDKDGFQVAGGLLNLGNLPASVGYVSLVILMLHSAGWFAKIRVLAPFGRMALTNYLAQSVIASMFFYGYGLGHWGMGRALQLVFVAVVVIVQIALSHWWLARFRFGPMEWLWRAVTYWHLPPMRIAPES